MGLSSDRAQHQAWYLPLTGCLLIMVLILIMGWLPWQDLQQKLQRHQDDLLNRLALTSEALEQQARVTADTLVEDLKRDPVVMDLLQHAATHDMPQVQQARQQLLRHLAPLYQDMQALQVRQFHFHDSDGNSFLRLHKPDQFGDALLAYRPALLRILREHKPLSVYEAGCYQGGYRNLYPLFSDGHYLGSLEVGFSPAIMLNRIRASFSGAEFYFIIATNGQSTPESPQGLAAIPGITGFALDNDASSKRRHLLQQFVAVHRTALQHKLEYGLPSVIRDNDQTLLLQPVYNLAGQSIAYMLVLIPDPYSQQLWLELYQQLTIGIIISLLVSGLIWGHYQKRRGSIAFRQLSLALQGGALRTWDYYPQRHLLVFGGTAPHATHHRQAAHEVELERWLRNLHPEDQPQVRQQLKSQLDDRSQTLDLEFRNRHNHSWRWISARGRAVKINSYGQVTRFSGVYRDITQDKQIQQALEQSEHKYRALFAGNKAVELIIDPARKEIVDANQAAVEYYGYPRHTLVGMPVDQINTLKPEQLAAEMSRASAENRSHFIFQHRLADDQVRDVEVYSGPLTLTDNNHYLYSIVHDITARKQAERALQDSKTRLDSLLHASLDGILMVDSRGRLEYWNQAAADALGCDIDLQRRQPLPWHQLQPEDMQWLRSLRDKAIRGEQISPKGRLRELCLSGSTTQQTRWLEVAVSSFIQANRRHFVAVIRDTTERKQREMALQQAQIAFENTMEGIVITDTENRIISVNQAVETISGYRRDELIGKPPSTFSSGIHGQAFYQAMWQTLQTSGHWQGEISNRHKSGRTYSEWLNINAVKDDNGHICNYVAVFSDITDLKASQERLDYLAHHDVLTGLPNRLVFRERLEQGMLRARRHNELIAVLFIDLDRFKHINDSLGHDVGDELLQAVSQLLRDATCENDTVVRLGGDEFSILMEHFHDQDAPSRLADRLVNAMSRPIPVPSGHTLNVGASIGIAVYPQDAKDATSLVKHADIAMYRAKELGKGRYECYNKQMTDAAQNRFCMESDLEIALSATDQIKVYYQPQVDLKSRTVCGIEALVRWQHPEKGFISPDKFIPLAEENGMIHRLGQRISSIVLDDLTRLRDAELFSGIMALNISTLELEQPDFADQLLHRCQALNLVESIKLEVTETGLGHNPEQFFAHLRHLRSCGFKVAIDDFGTGHSTLVRLKQCPADYLKIDRSFIRHLPSSLDDLVITRTILSLGQSLGQKVVAEGIEDSQQAALLSHLGCDIGQGYFFSKPLPFDQLCAYLQQHRQHAEQHDLEITLHDLI